MANYYREKEHRREDDDLGGTMRLGGQICVLAKNSLAEKSMEKIKLLNVIDIVMK